MVSPLRIGSALSRRSFVASGAMGLETAMALPLCSQAAPAQAQGKPITLLNVSYDPTRELYKDINTAFAAYWKGQDRTGAGHQAEPRRLGPNRPAR